MLEKACQAYFPDLRDLCAMVASFDCRSPYDPNAYAEAVLEEQLEEKRTVYANVFFGVGVGAADKDSMEYAVGHHISHKLALADQKAFVLDPLDGLTDEAESAGLR